MTDVAELIDDDEKRALCHALFGEKIDEFGDKVALFTDRGSGGEGVGLGSLEEGEEEGARVLSEEGKGKIGVVGDERFAFGSGKGGGRMVRVKVRCVRSASIAVPEIPEVEEEIRAHVQARLQLRDHG